MSNICNVLLIACFVAFNRLWACKTREYLVVEDEAPIRDMLRFALERADFRISLAGDVPEARLRIAESRPDLILLDWMMPGVSGIEFTRELKSGPMTKDIPIIMVTARAEEEDTVRGLNVGCDDYISKPFSFPELTARIQAVLRTALRRSNAVVVQQQIFASMQIRRCLIAVVDVQTRLWKGRRHLLKLFLLHLRIAGEILPLAIRSSPPRQRPKAYSTSSSDRPTSQSRS